jgi:hypothetical protein
MVVVAKPRQGLLFIRCSKEVAIDGPHPLKYQPGVATDVGNRLGPAGKGAGRTGEDEEGFRAIGRDRDGPQINTDSLPNEVRFALENKMSEYLIHYIPFIPYHTSCLVHKKECGSRERAEDAVSSISTAKQSHYLHIEGRCFKEKGMHKSPQMVERKCRG